jgi:hypothetical protein
MKNDELRNLNLDGWPISNGYLQEVGRVTVLWAQLESFLNVCVGKLAGFSETDVRWFVLINHSSFPQRLDMLGSLCEHLLPDHPSLKGYRDVMSTLRSAQSVRNKFTHHVISADPETGRGEIAIGSARGIIKATVEPIEAVDIRRAAIQVHDAMRSLYALVLGKTIPSITERTQSRGDGIK